MENNAYNRMISGEIDDIVRKYVHYQQKTGKEMRDDALVPLTKPLTAYGKGQMEGGNIFDDVLSGVSGAVKTAAQFAPLLALGKKGRRKGGEFKTVPIRQLAPANIRAPSRPIRSGNGSYARAIGSGAMDNDMFEKKAGSLLGSIVPFGNLLGLGEDGKVAGRRRGRPCKSTKTAGSLLGSVIPFGNLLGLGEDEKVAGRRRGRPCKSTKTAGSLLGSIVPFGNLLGLGEDGKVAGRRRGRPCKSTKKGGSLGIFGLGEEAKVAGKRKPGRPRKAGSIGVDLMAETKNNLLTQKKKGGSFLSDLVGAVQSVPSAVRQTKGVARDIQDIQNILKGKQARTRTRKTRKTRRGAGVFDDILSGIGSTIKTTAETLPAALQLGKMFGMGEQEKVGEGVVGDLFEGVKSTIRSIPGALKQSLDVARDVKDIHKILKGGKKHNKRKASSWVEHCKAFAKKNNMSFKDAMKDPRCKNSYKK